MRKQFLVSVVAVTAACNGGGTALEQDAFGGIEPLPAPAPGEGFQLGMRATVGPGSEAWLCQVIDGLPIDSGPLTHIQWGEHRQTPGMHHMDVMSLVFANVDLEPGIYDCNDVYQGADGQALMDDGIVLYASQLAEGTIVLPAGVVAEVPTRSRFLLEMHYVNTSDREQEVIMYMNGHTIDPIDVVDTIWGVPVRDLDINVPPRAEDHVEWTRCEMTDDVEVIFLSSHTHELARNFEVRRWDGESAAGDVLYASSDWQSPYLENYAPAMPVRRGEGFEFRCYYDSQRDTETHWGFSAQDEMCQIGIVFTPGRSSIDCTIVDSGTGIPQ